MKDNKQQAYQAILDVILADIDYVFKNANNFDDHITIIENALLNDISEIPLASQNISSNDYQTYQNLSLIFHQPSKIPNIVRFSGEEFTEYDVQKYIFSYIDKKITEVFPDSGLWNEGGIFEKIEQKSSDKKLVKNTKSDFDEEAPLITALRDEGFDISSDINEEILNSRFSLLSDIRVFNYVTPQQFIDLSEQHWGFFLILYDIYDLDIAIIQDVKKLGNIEISKHNLLTKLKGLRYSTNNITDILECFTLNQLIGLSDNEWEVFLMLYKAFDPDDYKKLVGKIKMVGGKLYIVKERLEKYEELVDLFVGGFIDLGFISAISQQHLKLFLYLRDNHNFPLFPKTSDFVNYPHTYSNFVSLLLARIRTKEIADFLDILDNPKIRSFFQFHDPLEIYLSYSIEEWKTFEQRIVDGGRDLLILTDHGLIEGEHIFLDSYNQWNDYVLERQEHLYYRVVLEVIDRWLVQNKEVILLAKDDISKELAAGLAELDATYEDFLLLMNRGLLTLSGNFCQEDVTADLIIENLEKLIVENDVLEGDCPVLDMADLVEQDLLNLPVKPPIYLNIEVLTKVTSKQVSPRNV